MNYQNEYLNDVKRLTIAMDECEIIALKPFNEEPLESQLKNVKESFCEFMLKRAYTSNFSGIKGLAVKTIETTEKNYYFIMPNDYILELKIAEKIDLHGLMNGTALFINQETQKKPQSEYDFLDIKTIEIDNDKIEVFFEKGKNKIKYYYKINKEEKIKNKLKGTVKQ